MENGVKVFHLVAEVVKREFLPGRAFDVWGYNGSMPGPHALGSGGAWMKTCDARRLYEKP